tara:strand:- start:288 stop:737 length:450 start_codon:yes stop_codon:yes gene_type:complete
MSVALARNDTDLPHKILADKETNRTENVSIANSTSTWNEPASTYASTYPKNHVMETESGHIREYDDTPDAERIHEYHKSGTFYEIDKNGNKITRVVQDNYEIIAGSNFVNVKGSANLTVTGDLNLKATGNINLEAEGNVKVVGTRIDLN